MCVVTILHCTPCKFREEMPEEGLMVTKNWHTQLLVSLDIEPIPFRRCIEAKVHALSISRSETLEYPRCRNVEVKHLVVTKRMCFRCSTRRKIQNLVAMRRSHEEHCVTWREDESRDAELVNNMRRSMKESPRSVPATRKEAIFCAAAGHLTARIDTVTPMAGSMTHCLEKQTQQRKLTKAKEAEKIARAEEAEQKEQKKQARLASVQQYLARMNRLRDNSVTEDDTEQFLSGQGQQSRELRSSKAMHVAEPKADSLSDETVSSQVHKKVPGPISSQDVLDPSNTPSSAVATGIGPVLPILSKVEARVHVIGPATAIKVSLSGKGSLVGAATHSVSSWALVREPSTLRAEAPEFASLRGFPGSLGLGSLRAEAPEFKPLREVPPTEPRMMRAPLAPRAMREGSLRRPSIQPRQFLDG